MKKEDIHWADWHRILIGSAPTEFLFEVFIRTVIMYLVLLVILRLMGKRMGGMLTTSELAIMVTLGAIICLPMQLPDRGILQGILVLICALTFHQGLNLLGYKSATIERVVNGRESMILKNGIILTDELEKVNISRQQLYAVLRSQGIFNLGEVERVYMEANKLFSVFKFKDPRPGLSIFPPTDEKILEKKENFLENILVCSDCGNTIKNKMETTENCSNCNHHNWQAAMFNSSL